MVFAISPQSLSSLFSEGNVWVGSVMIFTLVNAAQEHLRKEMEAEKQTKRKLREVEEEELKKKLEGAIERWT